MKTDQVLLWLLVLTLVAGLSYSYIKVLDAEKKIGALQEEITIERNSRILETSALQLNVSRLYRGQTEMFDTQNRLSVQLYYLEVNLTETIEKHDELVRILNHIHPAQLYQASLEVAR